MIPSSLKADETPESASLRSHEAWDPDWIVEHFYAAFRCANPSCKGLVHVVGTGSHQHSFPDDYVQVLVPTFFLPAPLLIALPEGTPEPIEGAVRAASSLYWNDASASGNRVRQAIELLLTEQRIPQSSAKSHAVKPLKHRRRLGLNERIKRFEEKKPALGERLHAIKWVGHDASHSGDLSKDDILDAMEILESVLDDLYAQRAARLQSMVKQINRRGRPRSKQGKREGA